MARTAAGGADRAGTTAGTTAGTAAGTPPGGPAELRTEVVHEQLRNSILFPGTEVAPEAILIGAIAGHSNILASLRRRDDQTTS